jgi:uncharacterized C2H2 Zn-finger protein
MNPEDLGAVDFVAATSAEGGVTLFSCPLCGGRFSHGEQVCSACPLKPGCDVVGCPHCGYQFPRTSAIVETLGRFFGWLGRRRT